MKERIVHIRFGILTTLLLLAVSIWLPTTSFSSSIEENILTVRFLDVGQGDSIQISTPDGYELLIDGGPSADVLRELAKGRDFFDKSIDIVVSTHPDTDHIGGLSDVLERYEIGAIMETEVEHDVEAARAFARATKEEGVQVISAQAGQEIKVGASTTIRILSPLGDTTSWESNTASIVVQVIYGEIEFMLTGDAPSSIEDYLVSSYGASLESDVLKLGHHGSKTSTSENFLNTVKPDYAIVSAGKDNRYGHPHGEVTARTREAGAEILSTAEQGTIVFKSDGKEVWVEN
jgi:competence protein ComEC